MPITVEWGPDAGLLAKVSQESGAAKARKEAAERAFQQQLQAEELALRKADQQQRMALRERELGMALDDNARRNASAQQELYWNSPYGRYQNAEIETASRSALANEQARLESVLGNQRYGQTAALQQQRAQEEAYYLTQKGLQEGKLRYTPRQQSQLTQLQEAYSRLIADNSMSPYDKQNGAMQLQQQMRSIIPINVTPDQQPIEPIERFQKQTAMVQDPNTGLKHYVAFDRNGVPKVIEFPTPKGSTSGAGAAGTQAPQTMADRISSDQEYREKLFKDAEKSLIQRRKAEYELNKMKYAEAISEGRVSVAPPRAPSQEAILEEVQRRIELDRAMARQQPQQLPGQGMLPAQGMQGGGPMGMGAPGLEQMQPQGGMGQPGPMMQEGLPQQMPQQEDIERRSFVEDVQRLRNTLPEDEFYGLINELKDNGTIPRGMVIEYREELNAQGNPPINPPVGPTSKGYLVDGDRSAFSARVNQLVYAFDGVEGVKDKLSRFVNSVKHGPKADEEFHGKIEVLSFTFRNPEVLPKSKDLLTTGFVYAVPTKDGRFVRGYWDGKGIVILKQAPGDEPVPVNHNDFMER